jgi:alpha-beta hydrolase superfamily lysophospholipase
MLQATDTRELIEVEFLGHSLRGTFHRFAESATDSRTGGSGQGRTAVLFLNSLALPRAASGDSAVYWAESFARRGYPAFRFDLPGLGDSDGETSTGLLDFINAGGYAAAATHLARDVVARGGFSGVVIVGHCAGSVSAIFAAAGCKECQGLILMDPYFHLPAAKRPEVREKLSHWVRRSGIGRALSNIYDRTRYLRLVLGGSSLPGNANGALLSKWKNVASAGLPILMFKAPGIKATGSKPRLGEFDYIQHVLKIAGRKSRVAIKTIDKADHSFANRAGREVVREEIENWLATNFPLGNLEVSAQATRQSSVKYNQFSSTKTMRPPSNQDCALEGR